MPPTFRSTPTTACTWSASRCRSPTRAGRSKSAARRATGMARTLPKVDVVFVGFGSPAAIVARELKDASVRMVALERGRGRDTVPDFQSPAMHDELAYGV